MSYTTQQLITDAFYTADIVSKEFESVTGTQVADGLTNLNFLLDGKTVEKGMIPYVSTDTFSGVVGQESYAISNLIEVYTLTFTINDVRYPVDAITRDRYFGSARANNIDSLPYSYYLERNLNGATVYMYFLPEDTYTFTIKGLYRLNSVTQFQDLELTIDKFYIDYLTFELAERLCIKYGYEVPPNVTKQIEKFEKKISKISSPLDMSGKKISPLSPSATINYGYANLGVGFVPTRGG